MARSAMMGDACVRDIPRLLTKEEIRSLSQIDSVKFTAATVLEFCLIARGGLGQPDLVEPFGIWLQRWS